MAMTENTPVIHGNHRCSGGYNNNRGQLSKEAIERMQHGWDDRELVEPAVATADGGAIKESELSSHF